MKNNFPFTAIVGQEQLKEALMICAIDPSVGGVLIRGDKGTAKSTAARALAAVMPTIQVRSGCSYNCQLESSIELCKVCADKKVDIKEIPVPFINLPLGATEDRVLGSLDFERALKEGKKAFQPGLLASANRGVLYIDEVNLLADHLVDILLDAAAMGVNSVQREGLSIEHPAQISLIGTMNLEEGDLRPQLLDRFGLMVHVESPRDPNVRAEVVNRRLAYEASPEMFAKKYEGDESKLKDRIKTAKEFLVNVSLSKEQILFISQICCECEIESLRADIILNKASCALAALNDRTLPTTEDIKHAAALVLPHRRRRKPEDQSSFSPNQLNDAFDKSEEQNQNNDQPRDNGTAENSSDDSSDQNESQDNVFAVSKSNFTPNIELRFDNEVGTSGRRSIASSGSRGQYIRATKNENPSQLAVDATLRHAVLRGGGTNLEVNRSDFHEKVRMSYGGTSILIAVDSSGSMAALKRMEAVKGAVFNLLTDAYQKRDKVGVVTFRGENAELALAPTKSIEIAREKLKALPTGGRTPLASGLKVALETAIKQGKDANPLLIIITDGRANVASVSNVEPFDEALLAAHKIAEKKIPALVIDSEADDFRFGKAKDLATAMSAEYLRLSDVNAETLTMTIRKRTSGYKR